MASVRAYINPEMLVWARTSAHYDVDGAAAKASVAPERYVQWERGETYPTMAQLGKLARTFMRPIGFFYLDEPPEEPEVITELRQLWRGVAKRESPELVKQVRLADDRRRLALELFDELGEEPPSFGVTASVDSDPEEVAAELRSHLGFSYEEQLGWPSFPAALKRLREIIEDAGILVFQVPSVDLSEMRGFALAKRPLPVIAYNAKDAKSAQIFTLFHELGHLLLDDSVLHAGSPLDVDDGPRIERWCNRLAAAALMPADLLSRVGNTPERGKKAFWIDREIDDVALRLKVSPAALVRRLRHFDLIADPVYEILREEFDARRAPDRGSSGGSAFRNRAVHLGTLLSKLAFANYYEGNITTHDLSNIFNLKVGSLGKMERELFGQNVRFTAE